MRARLAWRVHRASSVAATNHRQPLPRSPAPLVRPPAMATPYMCSPGSHDCSTYGTRNQSMPHRAFSANTPTLCVPWHVDAATGTGTRWRRISHTTRQASARTIVVAKPNRDELVGYLAHPPQHGCCRHAGRVRRTACRVASNTGTGSATRISLVERLPVERRRSGRGEDNGNDKIRVK